MKKKLFAVISIICVAMIIMGCSYAKKNEKKETLVIYSNLGEVINEFDLDEITYDIYPDEENPDNEYEDVEIHCSNGDIYIYYNHPYEIKEAEK